jgi:hypothetical protein
VSDPGNKRKISVLDVVLVLLIIALGYYLYTIIGGDLAVLSRLGSSSGGQGPFEQIGESLGAFGEGLRDIFGDMVP